MVLKVALLGAGGAGRRQALAVRGVEGMALHTIHDTHFPRADAIARELGGTAHARLGAALAEADLAIVCTPPSTHAALTEACIARGVHALVEKPFALDVATCDALVRTARTKGVTLGAVAQHRFAPDAQRLRRDVARGKFGRTARAAVRVRRRRTEDTLAIAPWRRDPSIAGGGVLVTVGFHYLDLACWILGGHDGPADVLLEADAPGFEHTATGSFQLGGTPCLLDVRWGDLNPCADVLEVAGSRGLARLEGDSLAGGPPPDPIGLRVRQLADFAEALREGRPPAVAPEDVRPALDLIFDVYRGGRP